MIQGDGKDRGKRDFLWRSSCTKKRLAVIREMWLQTPHGPESSSFMFISDDSPIHEARNEDVY